MVYRQVHNCHSSVQTREYRDPQFWCIVHPPHMIDHGEQTARERARNTITVLPHMIRKSSTPIKTFCISSHDFSIQSPLLSTRYKKHQSTTYSKKKKTGARPHKKRNYHTHVAETHNFRPVQFSSINYPEALPPPPSRQCPLIPTYPSTSPHTS